MSHDLGDRETLQLARQLTESFERLDQTLRDNMASTTNRQTISVQAGGIGVWLCATLCAVMFVVGLIMAIGMVVMFIKMDRMQDYWNVTLQYVPGLKDHLTQEKGKAP